MPEQTSPKKNDPSESKVETTTDQAASTAGLKSPQSDTPSETGKKNPKKTSGRGGRKKDVKKATDEADSSTSSPKAGPLTVAMTEYLESASPGIETLRAVVSRMKSILTTPNRSEVSRASAIVGEMSAIAFESKEDLDHYMSAYNKRSDRELRQFVVRCKQIFADPSRAEIDTLSALSQFADEE